MTSPVKESTEGPSEQRHWQTLGKAKEKHAQPGAEHTTKQHLLAPNFVAQAAPENAADTLHKGKG